MGAVTPNFASDAALTVIVAVPKAPLEVSVAVTV